VLVSHDIDSAEGLENLVRRFVPLEESLGLRSVNYLVPCGWPLDHGLLRELVARGHRLGIHGCDHSNRTPFCGAEERRRRIAAALPLVERYGIQGYRAPSLCRTPELFDELVRHFRYDSSIPTSGGLFPVPGNGCATARPFVLRGLTEVPITLPRDGSLLFLGYSPEAVLSLWKECAARLIRSGGWVVLLTHCERRFSGSEGMFKAYTAFLEHLRALDGVSFVTEAEVVESLGAGGKGPPQP
jgi:peptidoglycan/xylan/chitin deacetylase (PgdA/CDA1 family)